MSGAQQEDKTKRAAETAAARDVLDRLGWVPPKRKEADNRSQTKPIEEMSYEELCEAAGIAGDDDPLPVAAQAGLLPVRPSCDEPSRGDRGGGAQGRAVAINVRAAGPAATMPNPRRSC